MDWGNPVHHLNDIMDNKVESKIFDSMTILCAGQDIVPQTKGKRVRKLSTSILKIGVPNSSS